VPTLNMSRAPLWLLGGLLVVIMGCGGQGFVSPTFLKITVTPATLDIGDTAALQAVAHMSDGTTRDVTAGTQWSISDPSLATLTSGTITANGPGSVTIQAAYADVPPVSSAAVTVIGNLNTSAKVVIAPKVTKKTKPSISWANPASIRFGKALSSAQLNAQASVPGTYAYIPAAGTMLRAGPHTLGVIFTPQDTGKYVIAYRVAPIQVDQVIPQVSWPSPAAIQQGTALSGKQLNATSNVFGTFTYHPAAGTVLPSGAQKLMASFSPNDTTDYASVTATSSITVTGSTSSPPPPPPPTSCGGPTVNLNSSMSTGEIQNAIAGAANCSLILFAAGTYNITSTISIPCPTSGLTISGPTVPWPGPYKVTLNGSVSGGWGFAVASCSSPVTIQYLNWNGGEPSDGGGGFLYVAPATSNLTVQYNFIHGNQANVNTDHEYDTLIWLDGTDSDPASRYDNDDIIKWNILGNTNDGTSTNADCGAISNLFYYQGGYFDQIGGYCAAIGLHSSTNNFTIANNVIRYQEQGVKLYEGGSVPSQLFYDANLNFIYNDLSWIHRIGLEGQQNGNPSMNYNYNDMHDQAYPAWSSWGFSLPEGGASNCQNNVLIANLIRDGAQTAGPGSVEFWGNGSCSNNLVQGYWGAGMQFGFGDVPWAMDNNIIQQLANNSYINNEENIPCCYPQMSGNVESQHLAAVTSASPAISPKPAGSYSSPVTVTLTDTGATNGGAGPQGNTTIYYTTDGSTPTTSSKVCNPTPGTTSCSFAVAAGATLKAIGMWGSLNQPRSYPAGYGFVPSPVVSAFFKGSVVNRPGAKITGASTAPALTMTSVAIIPSQAAVNIGGTAQLKAIASFSDGSTKDVTTEFGWASSDRRTMVISGSGVLSGLATGKTQLSGSYQGQQASVLASSSVGEVNWSAPIIVTQGGTYSGNWQSTDAKTPAVTIATQDPVVIEDSHISSSSNLIKVDVKGADVTVRNSLGVALNASVKGQSNGVFLDIALPRRLDVENNYIENARDGVSVHGYTGDRSQQQTLVIRGNRVRNLNGLLSDGAAGYLPPEGANRSPSHFLEFENVQSVPGVDVGWNEVIDDPVRSQATDVINVYRSSGTANQPLEVHDTYIQDAHRGGGIKTEGAADDTVQNASAYTYIHDNQIVGAASYGIAFNAGHDIAAVNNRVISNGMLPDGTRIAPQRAALSNANLHGGAFYNNTMHDNLIAWPCWSSSCAADYSTNAVISAKDITQGMEESEYDLWLNKTASAGIRVGPTF
jgi:hypothetical protein